MSAARSHRRAPGRLWPLLLLACAACDELELPPPSHITYPRVLAMRAEVAGEPVRATPAPGETLELRVLVAGPEPLARLSYTVAVCPARPERGDVPACLAPPFEEQNGELLDDAAAAVSREGLRVTLAVPDEADAVERLLVIGTVCTQGDAEAAAEAVEPGRCVGADELPVTWVGHVTLELAPEDENLNPRFPDDAVRLDDEAWPGTPSEPREVAAGEPEPHHVAFDLSDAGREVDADGRPEELRIAHFATAGRFERAFTVLERSQPVDQPLEVEWQGPRPPSRDFEPPDSVTFVMVLRDGRGGVAFTTRSVDVR